MTHCNALLSSLPPHNKKETFLLWLTNLKEFLRAILLPDTLVSGTEM
jgi:hypothetical protein